MMENSKIEWCTATFSPFWGCVKVSPGCKNCYAENLAGRFGYDVWGKFKPRRMMSDSTWAQPLAWNRKAEKSGQPFRVFCGSMCDVFEYGAYMAEAYLGEQRLRLWKLIEQTPALTWMLLTKRPEAVNDLVPALWSHGRWPANVWIGASVEDQLAADQRIPELLKIQAPVRFLSVEPMLGPVDLRPYLSHSDEREEPINWVIVGGESGPRARPTHPRWVWDIQYDCTTRGISFFFKQWGTWKPVPIAELSSEYTHSKTRWISYQGHLLDGKPIAPEPAILIDGYWPVMNVGKAVAGRQIEGEEWSQFPDEPDEV
jgi:protein gp37